MGGDDDLIGSVIDDRYVISALLGEGGMGRVYLGQHVHLPRKVAVKVLHSKLTNDSAAVARFNREAASTSRIEHERVARVFDFGRMEGGATYLAMEYIPGLTLSEVLDKEGALAPSRVSTFVTQIAEGLGAAHKLDIVHRDLKPDNIIVVTDGEGRESVKIVDFGIAKAIDSTPGQTLTAPGFVTGTPEYMSPEQLLGKEIDRRSDVFALGLLAFRSLTNVLPFAAPNAERGFSAILSDRPRRLSDVAPNVEWSEGLQSVFDRVLARQPEDRYSTAAEFATAFHDAVATREEQDSRIQGAPTIHVNTGGKGERARVTSSAPEKTPSAIRAIQSAPVHDVSSRSKIILAVAAGVATVAVVAIVLLNQNRVSSAVTIPDVEILDSVVDANGVRIDTINSSIRIETDTMSASTAVSSSERTTGRARERIPDVRINQSSATGVSATDSGARATPVHETAAPARTAITSAAVIARMDSVRNALDALLMADPTRDLPTRAGALISRIDALLPETRTANDTARALLLKANLYTLAGDRSGACRTLTQVRAIAATAADRNSANRNFELWSC